MNFAVSGSRRGRIATTGFVFSAALFWGVASGQSAPVAKSKNVKKTTSPVASAAGLKPKGKGECVLNVMLAGQNANLLVTSFRSQTRHGSDSGFFSNQIASTATALVNNNIAVVIMFPRAKASQVSEQIAVSLALSVTFASRQGFKAGQTLPIESPTSKKVGTGVPLCPMDLVQTEGQTEGKSDRPSSLNRKRTKTRDSSWIATSGVVRLDSVSPQRVTFSIKNARLVAPQSKSDTRNQARGTLVINGAGEFRITEVDDGFR